MYNITVRFKHNRWGPCWHGSVFFTTRPRVFVVYVLFLALFHRGISLDIICYFIVETVTQICHGSVNYLLIITIKFEKNPK